MIDIAELIAKLEKATGPDPELDVDILAYITGTDRDSPRPYPSFQVRRFTASTDAALMLVPADPIYYDWSVERDDDLYKASIHAPHGQRAPSLGATPPIAICIAALKARAGGALP